MMSLPLLLSPTINYARFLEPVILGIMKFQNHMKETEEFISRVIAEHGPFAQNGDRKKGYMGGFLPPCIKSYDYATASAECVRLVREIGREKGSLKSISDLLRPLPRKR